jgi:hypothetical protein
MSVRIVSIALLVLFWFGLTTDTSSPEVLAAVLVTLAALAAYGVLQRHGEVPAGARLRWVWQALRDWPRRIISDTYSALATVASAPDGHVRQVDLGDADDVELAWMIVGTSIAPMSIVIGVDERRRKMLIHELVDTGKPDDEVVWRPR